MDFNTGSGSGRSDDYPGSMYGGEESGGSGTVAGGPASGGTGPEYDLSDPVGSFVRTVRGVVLHPVAFFAGVPRRGNFLNPLVFALICALISALLGGIFSLVLAPLLSAGSGDAGEAFGGALVGFVVGLFLGPIFAAIGLFMGSAISHLLVLLLVRPNAGYEATFRVASYSSAMQLVGWIPIVNIFAGIYGIVLTVLGIREVHSTTTARAALVVLIPAALVLLAVILLITVIGIAVFAGGLQAR